MIDQKTISELTAKIVELIAALIEGHPEAGEPGLGENLDNRMSMTSATVCYWGTSGKGNPNAKNRIRIVASQGYVRIEKKGRAERVGLTQKGLDLFLSFKPN